MAAAKERHQFLLTVRNKPSTVDLSLSGQPFLLVLDSPGCSQGRPGIFLPIRNTFLTESCIAGNLAPFPLNSEHAHMGRTSDYTPEIAAAICARLAEGEPLRQICRDEGMPAWRTVYDWKESHADFAAAIARAREVGYDAIAQECMDIADDTASDTITTENGDRANTEWISRSKLRIETRLKLLAKWDPKRYGDKVTQEHVNPDGSGLFTGITVKFVKPDDNG